MLTLPIIVDQPPRAVYFGLTSSVLGESVLGTGIKVYCHSLCSFCVLSNVLAGEVHTSTLSVQDGTILLICHGSPCEGSVVVVVPPLSFLALSACRGMSLARGMFWRDCYFKTNKH